MSPAACSAAQGRHHWRALGETCSRGLKTRKHWPGRLPEQQGVSLVTSGRAVNDSTGGFSKSLSCASLADRFGIWLMIPCHQLQRLPIISAGSRNSEGAPALTEEVTGALPSSAHRFWSTANAGFMGDYFQAWILQITTNHNSFQVHWFPFASIYFKPQIVHCFCEIM